jgi:hypothetical protein
LKACTKYWSDCRKIVPLEGDSQFVKIKEFPNNLVCKERDPYWYQFTEKASDREKTLVDKQTILEILRSGTKSMITTLKIIVA